MSTKRKAPDNEVIIGQYYQTDKDTKQLIIDIGTANIDRVLKPGTFSWQPGAARFLKQLVNSHESVPKRLHGFINLGDDGRWIKRADHFSSAEQKSDPTKLAWYFYACCKVHKCPTRADKMKIGGPYENNGTLILRFKNGYCNHGEFEAQTTIKQKKTEDERPTKRTSEHQPLLPQPPMRTNSNPLRSLNPPAMRDDPKDNDQDQLTTDAKPKTTPTHSNGSNSTLNELSNSHADDLVRAQSQRSVTPTDSSRRLTRNLQRLSEEATPLDTPNTGRKTPHMGETLEQSETQPSPIAQRARTSLATEDHQPVTEANLEDPEGESDLNIGMTIRGEKGGVETRGIVDDENETILRGDQTRATPLRRLSPQRETVPLSDTETRTAASRGYIQQHRYGRYARRTSPSNDKRPAPAYPLANEAQTRFDTRPAMPLNMYNSLDANKEWSQPGYGSIDQMKSSFPAVPLSPWESPRSDSDGSADGYRMFPAAPTDRARTTQAEADPTSGKNQRTNSKRDSINRGDHSQSLLTRNTLPDKRSESSAVYSKAPPLQDSSTFQQEPIEPFRRPNNSSYQRRQQPLQYRHPYHHATIHTTYSSKPDTRAIFTRNSPRLCTGMSFRRSSGHSDVVEQRDFSPTTTTHSNGSHYSNGASRLNSPIEATNYSALLTPSLPAVNSKESVVPKQRSSFADEEQAIQTMTTASTAAATMNSRAPITPTRYPQLRTVSVRSPKKLLTLVPISIPPTGTFADLISFVIPAHIRLPADRRWSVRSSNLAYQYMPQARVSESILGVEHAEVVIVVEKCAEIQLEDF
ncbi:hypothetical protein BGX27_003573 [Mortierella sp. AM989]|nr:hypothetical protein BGX27_003573 [Mortierella sp. AM989]